MDHKDEEQADDGAGQPVPVARWIAGHAIPDLSQVSERRWEELLRQVPRELRLDAALTLPDGEFQRALTLAADITEEERGRARASREPLAFPRSLPGDRGRLPERRLGEQRQINFRLYQDQHGRLERAATALGLRPAQLARLLTLRGVGQVLAEIDAGRT